MKTASTRWTWKPRPRADAAAFDTLATEIKDYFDPPFVNAATGQVANIADTRTSRILPLYLGMFPDDKQPLVLNLDRLIVQIQAR